MNKRARESKRVVLRIVLTYHLLPDVSHYHCVRLCAHVYIGSLSRCWHDWRIYMDYIRTAEIDRMIFKSVKKSHVCDLTAFIKVIRATPALSTALLCCVLFVKLLTYIFVLQNNAQELRAERLRRATEKLRNPVVFNKDSAVRKTQLKSFSQYVENRPGRRQCNTHTHTQTHDAWPWVFTQGGLFALSIHQTHTWAGYCFYSVILSLLHHKYCSFHLFSTFQYSVSLIKYDLVVWFLSFFAVIQ